MDHLALLPWADELTSAAIDLVQVETVTSAKEQPKTEAEAKPEVKPKPKVVLIDDEEEAPEEAEAQAPAPPRIIDEEPTTQDSKHPALRRAAIVFLGLLLASVIEAANNARDANKSSEEFQMRLPGSIAPRTTAGPASTSGPAFGLPSATLERAATVLSYVAMTDVDEVVRGQAGEVVALVERLRMLRAGPQML